MRQFREADAEQVAALWQRVFRKTIAPPSKAVRDYFVDVLLKNPWYDPDFGSLLMEKRGEIVGFIGRMARPMLLRGQPIRTAVATQLMIDPNKKLGFATVRLVRAVQQWHHDILYSDGANAASYPIWMGCGGRALRLLSFEWTRPLRPAQSLIHSVRKHSRYGAAARLGRPLARAWDAVSVRALPPLYHMPKRRLARRIANAGQILPLFNQVSSAMALRPVYTEATYSWVLHKAAEARSMGELRSVIVDDDQGVAIGWFIYFANAGHPAHVLQAGALPGSRVAVLEELYRDAWEQGAISVTGQLDPLLMTDLSNTHCQFHCHGMGVLVHAHNPDALNALHAGDVFISRLEGEWWMRLGIDRHYDW